MEGRGYYMEPTTLLGRRMEYWAHFFIPISYITYIYFINFSKEKGTSNSFFMNNGAHIFFFTIESRSLSKLYDCFIRKKNGQDTKYLSNSGA